MSKRLLVLILVVIGGGGAARAAVTVTAAPPTIEFGSVAINGTKAGTTTLTSDAGTVSANVTPDAGCDFTTSTATVTITTSGVAANFTFKPTAAGSRSCNVAITDSTDGTPLTSVMLHGTGTGTAMISVTPGPLQFNGVGVGETSGKLHVTATNNGTDVLMISAASIVTTPGNYVITGTTGTQNVAVGGHADWDIACKPTTLGAVDDVFRITSNATVPMSDTVLKCLGQQGILTVTPTSLDFGSVVLNGMRTLPVTLKNTGNVAVTGIASVLDNTTVGYAVVAGTVPAMLAAGDSADVMVKFAPTKAADGITSHLKLTGTWTVGSAHNIESPQVTLNGKTIALTLSTAALAFGDFRYDTLPKQSFTLKNDGTGDVLIGSITLTPDTGTKLTELPFTITLNSNPAVLTTPLHAGEMYVVSVVATPENRTGAIGGKLVVASSGLTLAPVVVTGNATAAMFQTTDASFGAVDVQASPVTLKAVIKNATNATASLDVGPTSIKSKAGTDTAFSYTLTGARSLAPGDSIEIPVTYKPTLARPAGDADTVVLQATLTGALDGPRTMQITLTGRGIDRHLVLPATAPAFPSTFRNPGDTAPIVPVTITNSGEASMTVSAVMIDGAPVWQLLDPDPVEIPGGMSHDFMVKFAPTDVGPAPHGQVMFKTNDSMAQAALIPLDGTAVARAVAFGPSTNVEPRTIDLGTTGANIPVTLDDAMVVVSMDPGTSFTIHRIDLTPVDASTAPFKIDGAPDDDTLAPMATRNYAVTFDPTASGHFEVMATLYLDQDPVPHSQFLLAGDAVYVEAHGGGGCDTGGTRGPGGLVIGLAAFGLIRRRRKAVAA